MQTQIAPRSLVLGSPARVIRELTEGEVASIHALAQKYVGVARRYREGGAGSRRS
jgi:carbonic anhydrase/acetyltransferase-like protein (isoleucine patch superfamily)